MKTENVGYIAKPTKLEILKYRIRNFFFPKNIHDDLTILPEGMKERLSMFVNTEFGFRARLQILFGGKLQHRITLATRINIDEHQISQTSLTIS